MKQSTTRSALMFTGLMIVASAAGVAMAQDARPAAAPAAAPKAEGTKKKKDHHDPTIKKQDFGTTTVAGVMLQSITQEGAIMAGQEGAFDIVIAEGQTPPKVMRGWIGIASGVGSEKTKLEKEPNRHYHSHVDAPSPLPPGSQYWLEVEPESGPKVKASFNYFTEE